MTAPKPQEAGKPWFRSLMGKTWGQLLVFAGGLVLYLLLGLLLWWGLNLYINPQDSAQKKDLVQALALIMAGVAGVIGIFFTWRGQRITQTAQEANLDITRRGQITERFTQAIDQLGATARGKKSLEIRLGAIYSLARIARDSESDHWPVMEVLTAYVRLHSPRKLEEKESQDGVHPPELDIQAILTVLSQRSEHHHRKGLEYGPIDLHDTNLPLADLSLAKPEDPGLKGANLQGANLQGADLRMANLQEADLQGADLQGANFEGANLQYTTLQGANLQGAKFWGGQGIRPNLKGAIFWEADLTGADLSGADLQDTYLLGANFQETKLGGANLSGVNLSTARGLSKEQLEETLTDEDTMLPESLQ
jgi:hypothetical protein